MSVSYGILSRIFDFLRRICYLSRPAKLKLCEENVLISITGNTVTIRRDAIFDRGWVLWFADGGRFDIPLPAGLPLGTEVTCRSPGIEVDFHGVGPLSVKCNLRKLLETSETPWEGGQRVHLEIISPCATEQLLLFPSGGDGVLNVEGEFVSRTIVVRKNPAFRDVIIRNHRWRRLIPSAEQVSRIILSKNEETQHVQIDRVRTQSRSLPASEAAVQFAYDPADSLRPNEIRADIEEVAIPLSFDHPDAEYKIVLLSEQPQ